VARVAGIAAGTAGGASTFSFAVFTFALPFALA
jgi:hypothetical protein